MISSALDPETVNIVSTAYEDAWREIEAATPSPMSEQVRSEASTALTRHLLAALESGERDPTKLKLLALAAMGVK
jgi:hypothetical protein